jgi:predicted Fe-Mo cluster-binding NifX family protein
LENKDHIVLQSQLAKIRCCIQEFCFRNDESCCNYERKRGLKTVEFLRNEDVDVLLFNGEINEGPSYALSDELINIVCPNEKNLKDMLLS